MQKGKTYSLISFLFLILFSTHLKAQKTELILPIGHSNWVTAVCFTPDGKYVVTASADNLAKLWEISTGKEIRTFAGHSNRLSSAAISPDGKYLLTGSEDSTARVWDISTGVEIQKFNRDSAWVNAVAFSPDGKFALLGSGDFYSVGTMPMMKVDNAALLFEISSGKQVMSFVGHKDDVNAVAFSPDGKYVLTGSGDNWFNINTDISCRLWDAKTGKELKTFHGHTDKINSVAFSPDGKLIVTGSKDGTAKIWDIATGKEMLSVKDDDNLITSATFSPDGKTIATGSMIIIINDTKNYHGNEVKLWDATSGKLIKSLKGHTFCIKSVAFSKDGKSIISGGYDMVAKLWDVETGKEIKTFRGYSHRVTSVAVSPDGRFALVGSGEMLTLENTLKLWDLRTGKQAINFPGKIGMISSVYFSSDGKQAMSGSWDKKARLWDIKTGKEISSFSGHTNRVNSVALSPDGNYALTGSEDMTAKLWDIKTGKEVRTFKDSLFGIQSVLFSPDSKYAFILGKNLFMYDVSTGNRIKSFEDMLLFSMAISPDGKKIICGCMDGTVNIWDVESGNQSGKYKCHSDMIWSVAFSPDGTSFITACHDRTIKQWNTATGAEIKVFKGHYNMVSSAKFTPDGKNILSGSSDNTTRLWDVFTGKEIASLISLDVSDWIITTPDYYYACSKGALDIMAFKIGSNAYPFEQFDIQYNRPDIVLAGMNKDSKELVVAYKAAYNKRLRQLGFTEKMFANDFHVPTMTLVNAYQIPFMSTNNTISATLKAFDEKYKIDRINVFVNDIPLYGMKGLSTREQSSNTFQKDMTVELSKGMNKIMFSCINEKGIESFNQAYEVNYKTPEAKNDLYLIIVSSSEYKDARMNLRYAVKDGRDIAKMFQLKKTEYNHIYIDTLFNTNATKDNVIELKSKLSKSKVDDEVVVYASGHGLLDDSLDFYFATYDVDFNKPNIKGLPYNALENLLDGIPARKKILMIDACHSGEVDKEMLAENKDVQLTLDDGKRCGLKTYTYRGVQAMDNQQDIGLVNSFELMQELFANLSKGSGAVVVSAAAGSGYALESPEWNNGVFTYCIINGLKNKFADADKDGIITISELRNYVLKEVENITKGAQKPTSRRDNLSWDFKVW